MWVCLGLSKDDLFCTAKTLRLNIMVKQRVNCNKSIEQQQELGASPCMINRPGVAGAVLQTAS